MMRFVAMGVVLLAAMPVGAEVRLEVRPDGSKVIHNTGRTSRASDGALQWLVRQRDRSTRYDPIIEKYAKAYDVDPILVKAVIQVESDFNPSVVSHKGARGLMQLMPATARRFNVGKVHDPDENIRGGVEYLAFLLRHFSWDLPRAVAAYNAGEGAVKRYGGIPPYAETQTYVRRVLTVYYGRPWGVIEVGLPGGRRLSGESLASRPGMTLFAGGSARRSVAAGSSD